MGRNGKIETRREMFRDKTPKEVFDKIFEINDWSSSESVSGWGSTLQYTENTRAEMPIIFEKYGIKRFLDVACGDFNWMKEIVHHLEYYKGTDIVEKLIALNNEKYGVEGKVEFGVNDLTTGLIVDCEFDAIMAKDVLVHMPTEYAIQVLEDIKNSGIKYIFLTHFDEIEANTNIESFGLWRPLNFNLKPFNYAKPIEIIREPEPYHFAGSKMMDKTLSVWKIEDLV